MFDASVGDLCLNVRLYLIEGCPASDGSDEQVLPQLPVEEDLEHPNIRSEWFPVTAAGARLVSREPEQLLLYAPRGRVDRVPVRELGIAIATWNMPAATAMPLFRSMKTRRESLVKYKKETPTNPAISAATDSNCWRIVKPWGSLHSSDRLTAKKS